MIDFMQLAVDAMAAYGLVAVFILLVLDGAMLLPAVPGEVILIFAVTQYATDTAGLFLVLAVAVGAAMVGSVLVYAVGRGATGSGKKRRKVFGITPKRQEKMEKTFSRPAGQSMVFFLRLFPLTRVLVSLPAGIARMRFVPFFLLSLLGTVVFYVAFLWLAYEFRKPDSAVASTVGGVRAAAYESPAWTFIEANWIFTGIALILIGIVLSVRASRRMARDHEETSGSLIGTLVTAALFWGGIATLVGLWLDASLVYRFLGLAGVDAAGISWGVPFEPLSVVALFAALAVLVALMIRSIRSTARKENRRLRREQQKLEYQGRLSGAPDDAPPPAQVRQEPAEP